MIIIDDPRLEADLNRAAASRGITVLELLRRIAEALDASSRIPLTPTNQPTEEEVEARLQAFEASVERARSKIQVKDYLAPDEIRRILGKRIPESVSIENE